MTKISVLDNGYIEVVESWGSDERIVEAARMSTGKGFLGWEAHDRCADCGMAVVDASEEYPALWGDRQPEPSEACKARGSHDWKRVAGDEKLLRYLYENRHDTPFEMAGLIVEVQAPIIVFREWHRHRVPWSYNEASARYAPLPAIDYVPTIERMMRGGGHLTKQAGAAAGAEALREEDAHEFLDRLVEVQAQAESLYQWGLKRGVPKELARLSMTVGRYSKMRASSNLRGWLHFLGLRSAPNAQEEIRVYANAAAEILRARFPRTMALYDAKR